MPEIITQKPKYSDLSLVAMWKINILTNVCRKSPEFLAAYYNTKTMCFWSQFTKKKSNTNFINRI